MDIVTCTYCKNTVVMMADGRCPACRKPELPVYETAITSDGMTSGPQWIDTARRRAMRSFLRTYRNWIFCVALSPCLLVFGLAVLFTLSASNSPVAIKILGVFALVGAPAVTLLGFTAWVQLIYRAWSVVQDGQARTTPGRAVGLLFLPLFNVYWMFVAIAGLGAELTRVSHERGITTAKVPYGLGLAACVGSLLSMAVRGSALWHISLVLVLASSVLHFIYMWFVARAAQQLCEAA